jgi:hypothetical protein
MKQAPNNCVVPVTLLSILFFDCMVLVAFIMQLYMRILSQKKNYGIVTKYHNAVKNLTINVWRILLEEYVAFC